MAINDAFHKSIANVTALEIIRRESGLKVSEAFSRLPTDVRGVHRQELLKDYRWMWIKLEKISFVSN